MVILHTRNASASIIALSYYAHSIYADARPCVSHTITEVTKALYPGIVGTCTYIGCIATSTVDVEYDSDVTQSPSSPHTD